MWIVVDDEQRLIAFDDVVTIVQHDLFTLRHGENRNGHGHPPLSVGRDSIGRRRGDRPGRSGVVERQIQRECAALTGHAHEANLAAEQRRKLAADRETETGSAVLAAGTRVRLLERFEDQPLLFRSDADAGVRDLDGDRGGREPKNRMIGRPPAGHLLHAHLDLTVRRELERIREQVLQNLLQTFRVARERSRQRIVDLDLEAELFDSARWWNVAFDIVAKRAERDLLGFDGDRAGFNLREVEDVVDERQQVGAGRVDVLGEVDLLRRQVTAGLSASCWPRMRIELSGVRSSCDMFARNSDLYFEVSASSAAFSSSARRACSTSLFFRSTSTFCSASCFAFERELLVGLLQLGLPRLQLDGQLLRLLQQVLGPHRGLDGVEHDADRLGELFEERQVRGGERLQRRRAR